MIIYQSHNNSEMTVPHNPLTRISNHCSRVGHSNSSNWVKFNNKIIGHMSIKLNKPMKPTS